DIPIVDAVGEAVTQFTSWEKNDGYVVQGLSFEETVDRIDPDTELIGLSCMFTHSWPMIRELLRCVHERFPDVLLVAGGEHVTSMYEMVMEQTPVDLCVLGEGEETLLELLDAIAAEKSHQEIPGLAVRDAESDKVVKTGARARIRNVDDLPWPAWDLIDPMAYLETKVYIGPSVGKPIPMLATRGCPYQCTFCSSKNMWTTRYWTRDVKDVVDEMEHYQKQFGASDFQFQDLTAIIKKSWIVDFCNEIISRKLDLTWQIPVGTRSEAIDSEVAELLVKSGCTYIQYAPESGSEKILKSIKKRVKLDNLLESVQGTLDAGMRVCVLLIIGFPDETKEDLRATFRFMRRLARMGVHEIAISCLVPLPGTEIFENLRKDSLIELDDDYCYWMSGATAMTQVKSWNPRFTDSQIIRKKLWGLSQFYALSFLLHPTRFFHVVKNLITGKQDTKVDRVLRELVEKRKVLKKVDRPTATAG
ncbi:MAG: B12-binding domain-containing radical SAM protein, partial [Planctomycetales bacterium]